MIDTSKMVFVETPAERSPMVLVKGRLQILSEKVVNLDIPIAMDLVKEGMREEVWRYAYHDLIDPLMRLQRLVKIFVPPPHQEEAAAYCAKLNELLARKK